MKIDWLYFRKGWVSCKKAQEFLDESKTEVSEISDAKKEKFDFESAWNFLKTAQKLKIARGKKILEFEPIDANKDEILKIAMGRSGNLRAPTVKLGSEILVGYNEELYQEKF